MMRRRIRQLMFAVSVVATVYSLMLIPISMGALVFYEYQYRRGGDTGIYIEIGFISTGLLGVMIVVLRFASWIAQLLGGLDEPQ